MLLAFTVLWLCIYVPLETYASAAGGGIVTFGYLIDLVGMVLMSAGVLAARRTQPTYTILAAGWAWTSANFWRGTMERYWAADRDLALQFGSVELIAGPVLTALAIAALVATLWREVATRRSPQRR